MISRNSALSLIQNLRNAVADGGPRNTEGMEFYVETLMDCPDDKFASDLVRTMIQEYKRFPAIADIRELMRSRMQDSNKTGKPSWMQASNCTCDHGWRFVWALCDMRAGVPINQQPITEEQYNVLAEQIAREKAHQCVYQGVEPCRECDSGGR